MDKKTLELTNDIIGETYQELASQNLNSFSRQIRELLAQRRLPAEGWTDLQIENLLLTLSQMDTNNFQGKSGVGEREGRVFSALVKKRNYFLGHGIGRSGTVDAIQPKAPGSSLLLKITKFLVLDAIKSCSGIQFAKDCIVLPSATGIGLLLSMLALKSQKPEAEYVIWFRIDQKTCLKSIISAGLKPIIIDGVINGDAVDTNIEAIQPKIDEIGKEKILAIMTTTSCFAPRTPDKLVQVAQICKENDLYHLVNNAYGLQCSKISNALNQAKSKGRVDVVVQSTDKNYMVPVGGSIIFSSDKKLIKTISSTYPGRASSSPIIDLLITMLSLGSSGLKAKYKERKELLKYFYKKFEDLLALTGDRVLDLKQNSISIAFTVSGILEKVGLDKGKATELGALLFKRRVMGARVVGHGKKEISGFVFTNYGSHVEDYPFLPYMTVACSIGSEKEDIDKFCDKVKSLFKN